MPLPCGHTNGHSRCWCPILNHRCGCNKHAFFFFATIFTTSSLAGVGERDGHGRNRVSKSNPATWAGAIPETMFTLNRHGKKCVSRTGGTSLSLLTGVLSHLLIPSMRDQTAPSSHRDASDNPSHQQKERHRSHPWEPFKLGISDWSLPCFVAVGTFAKAQALNPCSLTPQLGSLTTPLIFQRSFFDTEIVDGASQVSRKG